MTPIMDISKAIALMRTQPDDLLSEVLEITKTQKQDDLLYFEGSDFESDNDVFEYQFNLTLAHQLNCDVILVVSAKNRTLEHTLSILKTALEVSKKHMHVLWELLLIEYPPLTRVRHWGFFTNIYPNWHL
ncbi:AAA family ATPase [Legionella tunisiensis]|uniref:AAA family ATPase n=1 Tax=Legionella tunisiensis TaxID=1034944 RepID=UPI0002FFF6B5